MPATKLSAHSGEAQTQAAVVIGGGLAEAWAILERSGVKAEKITPAIELILTDYLEAFKRQYWSKSRNYWNGY